MNLMPVRCVCNFTLCMLIKIDVKLIFYNDNVNIFFKTMVCFILFIYS